MCNINNIQEQLYQALKIRSRALKRLTDFENYAYALFMNESISNIPQSELLEINCALVTEKECIRLCDILLKSHYN